MRPRTVLLIAWLIVFGMPGCKPDPRDSPDFRHETLHDPGRVADPPSSAYYRSHKGKAASKEKAPPRKLKEPGK
jgi:hypothetical protein